MLAEAKARRFDVVVVDDPSRLSRDEVELKQTVRRLRHWGVRIIGVGDSFDSESKGYKVQATVRGLVNEMCREAASARPTLPTLRCTPP